MEHICEVSLEKEKHKKNYYKYCALPKGSVPLVIILFGTKVAQIIWGKQLAFVLESESQRQFMKYFNYFWKKPW